MKIQEYINAVKNRKGANLKAIWQRPMKTRKGVLENVQKRVTAVVRGGVEYDNIGAVIEARADGDLPAVNAGLPWGEWANYPYHISHKGQDYARMYAASGIEFKPHATYLLDGIEVTREVVEPLVLASEFRKEDDAPVCFTIKCDNLIAIG